MITWNDSVLRIRAASATPIEARAKAPRNITGHIFRMSIGVSFTPTSGANRNTKVPWVVATVAPPSVLPKATAARLTGATSTSFSTPNSRS